MSCRTVRYFNILKSKSIPVACQLFAEVKTENSNRDMLTPFQRHGGEPDKPIPSPLCCVGKLLAPKCEDGHGQA